MNVAKIKKLLYNQTPLRILSFLSLHPSSLFSAKEISQQAHSSKGATHKALKLFLALDIIYEERKGNTFLYTLNNDSLVLTQFKIFENILRLSPIIERIKPYCYQIILFGSCANGTNTKDSDIDLFIKSEYKKDLLRLIDKYSSQGTQINPAIFEPLEIVKSEKEDKVFFEQVKKGITLWEGKPKHEKL